MIYRLHRPLGILTLILCCTVSTPLSVRGAELVFAGLVLALTAMGVNELGWRARSSVAAGEHSTIRRRIGQACIALALAILSLISTASVAQAQDLTAVATTLTIQPLGRFSVGVPVTVVAQLSTPTGELIGALNNEAVELFVNGVRERRARTDTNGTVSFRIRGELSPGTYSLKVVYGGTRSLLPSSASTELVIEPAEVEIYTVPAVPGIVFSMDGETFVSDKNGLAQISVEKAGVHQLRILSLDVDPDNMRVEFNRWADEEFKPDRQVELPLNRPLYVGLDISYRVRQKFIDLDGQPVDNTRITSVTMKSSDGTVYTLEAGQTMWLPANHVMRRFDILEPTILLYSTMNVEIRGTNVVNQAQQRFYVRPNDVWQIKLLLYSARFTARDALFGFPIGSGIHLEYPDGHSEDLPFGPDSDLKVEGLARGLYRVTVLDASGMAPRTPVAMSRYQDVELLVISYFDMAVVFLLGASLALGLLFLGRPKLLMIVRAFPSLLASKFRSARQTDHPHVVEVRGEKLEAVPEEGRESVKIIFAEVVDDVPGSALEPKPVEKKAEDEKQIARKTKRTTTKAKTDAKRARGQTNHLHVGEVRGEELEVVPEELRESVKIIFAEVADDVPGSALEPKPAEEKVEDEKKTRKKTKPTKAKAKTNAKIAPRQEDRST